MDSHTDGNRDLLEVIVDRLTKIETLLTGNGSPEKGIIVRLDRMEVKSRRHDRITWTLFGVTATGIATLLFDAIITLL